MPKPLVLAAMLEILFITLTTLLVVQPEVLFKGISPRVKQRYLFLGWMFMCVTFVWSVICGSLYGFLSMQLI